MFNVFEAATADTVWQMIASQFRAGVNVEKRPSRAGLTYEIARSALTVHDPRQRWVTSRQPAMNPAFALAEIIWIMRGRNDSAFVTYFNNELPRYAGRGPQFHGAYGFRLRRHFGFDQIDTAFHALRAKPHSRQIVLQLWDGRSDLPSEDGGERAADIPCNIVSMLKLRNGALEWTQVLRSNDAYRGLPYNLVQFTALHEILAGWLEVALGVHNQLSDSLHVYDDCLPYVTESTRVNVLPNSDSLAMPKEESDNAFGWLEAQVERIIDPRTSAQDLIRQAQAAIHGDSINNILFVLCAEGLRRRCRPDLISDVMSRCTNLCYRQLMDRWLLRVSPVQSAPAGP